MTLPKASELDAWLAGYAACAHYSDPSVSGEIALYTGVLRWLRTNNDRAAFDVPNLPDIERLISAARTPEDKREALRALLAARDRVVANTPKHDAVQAQAVIPLKLGLHPTGHAMEEE
jgi:hypothetical protein